MFEHQHSILFRVNSTSSQLECFATSAHRVQYIINALAETCECNWTRKNRSKIASKEFVTVHNEIYKGRITFVEQAHLLAIVHESASHSPRLVASTVS